MMKLAKKRLRFSIKAFKIRSFLAGTGIVFLAGAFAGANGKCFAASSADSCALQDAQVDTDRAHFEATSETRPILQAIKKVDPQEYEAFRQTIAQGLSDQVPQSQLNEAIQQFTTKMLQKHLRRATPGVLKQYLQARYNLYDYIGAISLETLYVYMATGALKAENLSEENRRKLEERVLDFFAGNVKGVTNVVTASPADKPLRQDADSIEKSIRKISQKIPDSELRACINPDQSGVNRTAYCNVLLRFYREALKLSDKDAVMVFRSIKELPTDDRAPSL